MAYRILRVCGRITNSIKNCQSTIQAPTTNLLCPSTSLVQAARYTSFFNKRPADQLWKAVTSVSNAGKRRGRQKGIGKRKDLNVGQRMGCGKVPVQFPGLNAPLIKGREVLQYKRLDEPIIDEKSIIAARSNVGKRKRVRLTPLERGWSGYRLEGRKVGPPDPVNDESFEDFQSWVLHSKVSTVITNNLGRQKKHRIFVVVGNGNGLVGFATAKGNNTKSILATAKNKAIQKLMHIERYNNHTVFHDFFVQFGNSKVYVTKKHEGYGLVCHRAIKVCCEAIGIKDINVKIEGSTNIQYVIKAFFIGLLKQKTHAQLAEEKQLHLVELRQECDNFPVVVASPSKVRTKAEIPPNEIINFQEYIMDGKVVLQKKKPLPFYTKLPTYERYLRRQERVRGHNDIRLALKLKYGSVRSYLTKQYPEAVPTMWKKRKDIEEEAEN